MDIQLIGSVYGTVAYVCSIYANHKMRRLESNPRCTGKLASSDYSKKASLKGLQYHVDPP